MLSTYPRLRKGEEFLFWILHKIMEIILFLANVHQCNIAFGVVCLYKFVLNLFIF